MYPHNIDVHQVDAVQIEAPDYDPDIDRDKESLTENKRATVSVQEILDNNHNILELVDDKSTTPDTTTPYQDHKQTDWPDAPTIQIPGVSSTTGDLPPEVTYNRCTTQYTADDKEIPQLEEEDRHYSLHFDNFISHHNTHQESECICQEYSAQLQSLDNNQYYHEIDQVHQLQYSIPVAPYNWPSCHKPPPNPPQAPLRSTEELRQMFGKG